MSNNRRVFHQRGFTLKLNQALRGIENCALAWIEQGVSVRDLTPAEAIAARNKQAADREILATSEIPGLLYMPPAHEIMQTHQSKQLARDANKFFEKAMA